MAGIFDFIKKQSPNANEDDSVQNTGQSAAPEESASQEVRQTQPVDGSETAAANGQSYNGIGAPPASNAANANGQSYNGIGAPQAPDNGTTTAAPDGQSVDTVQTQAPQAAEPVAQQPQQMEQNQEVKPDLTGPTGQTSDSPAAPDVDAIQNVAQESSNQPSRNNTSTQGNEGEQGASTQQADSPEEAKTEETEEAKQDEPQEGAPVTQNEAKNVLKSQISGDKRSELDIMTHLSQRSNKVFVEANKKAKELNNTYVDSEHLLHGLLTDGEIYKILVNLKVQPQIVEQELTKVYKKEDDTNPPQMSPRIKQIVEKSLAVARKMGYEFVSPEHLLLALYEEGEGVGARVLVKLGITKEDINKAITGKKQGVSEAVEEEKKRTKNALERYAIDLTAKAANGELDPVVERSPVIERVVHILSRRIKNNPALIGEPGVGKTAVVEGLAQRIVSKQVPESLLGKRILQLDLASVIAGASHRGEFEERMKAVVDELKASKGDVIMFLDEMHTMMGAGSGEGAIDASNFIKPALARGEVQFIGATTITEYRKYIEKDPALERRFQTILVPEPNEESSIKMLKATKSKYESFHKVKIPDEVIELAVRLSKRYIGDRFLPDKAFDLMDEASAAVRLPLISLPEEIKSLEERIAHLEQDIKENERRGEKVKARISRSKLDEIQAKLNEKKDEYDMKKAQTTTKVTPHMVKDIVATRTGIPVSKIGSSEGEKLANLEDIIHKRMVDQERAVESVAQAVRRGRAGLKSNNRPIGSFVFLGPTGVGKTELAKTLSEVLFDEEEAVIRFDMTEYMERHEVAKLLGPPPGYVGFEEGGKLTEAVRRKPYSLVLFDEIEKAHPDIFNILLQILDDARLTDNKGRTISFKNTVVICTSNIGTPLIQKELLKSGQSEVTEPTVISTYTFTPSGRELMTIGNKYFERSSSGQNTNNQKANGSSWEDHNMTEYFAGQKVDLTSPTATLGASIDSNKKNEDSSENSKEQSGNQKAPQPENQESIQEQKKVTFPTFGYDTHAVSPKGAEHITIGDTVYMRDATTAKVWKATNLIDYFKDDIVINAVPDAPDEQLPTVRLKTHAFTPDNTEVITYKDRYWERKDGSSEWKTGILNEYFDQNNKENNLPVTHWDIHTFAPSGREIIIVGEDIWYKEKGQNNWIHQTLEQYFGNNFPLEKEVEEKKKVEVQTDKKQYQVIKDKVMNELLKFFRPELVNRFDEVIVFEPLKYHHMTAIVKLQLKGLSKLLEEQEIGFSATDVAIKEIVRAGFDPVFGARPLRRAIQKLIENPISELIIAQKVKAGDTLVVDYDGQDFIFNIEKIERKYSPEDASNMPNGLVTHKSFKCDTCSNQFETDVIPTATTVCTKCASSKVQEADSSEEKTQPLSQVSTQTTPSTSEQTVQQSSA